SLHVGRNASLTLREDSLMVIAAKVARSIPFFNVLWAELSGLDVTIHHALPNKSKKSVRVAYINYTLEERHRPHADIWVDNLLSMAYGKSQRKKRIKVLVNPFGGQGKAQTLYTRDIEPIFAAARCVLDVESTKYSGHAVEIARNLDTQAWDVIACCSGDGVPHEVFNGLGKKEEGARALSQVAVVQLPCGSGNALSLNLNGTNSPSLAALAVIKGIKTPMDLVSVTQGDRRILSFLSQAVGIVAETDLATEHLRWMGDTRFTWGFLSRLLTKTIYPADIAIEVEIPDKASIKQAYDRELSNNFPPESRRGNHEGPGLPHLRFGTVQDPLPPSWALLPYDNLGSFYAGNMSYMTADANFFPAALPSDGCLDLVTIAGDISRIAAVQSLLAVEKNTFFGMPHVNYRKIRAYRIIPKHQKDGYVSIDGERVAFEPFQAECHRGLGTVLSKSGHVYEAQG
ncbi:sphingoid long chain base kinase-like protein, partial [Patellaria atrata CBS 101060]